MIVVGTVSRGAAEKRQAAIVSMEERDLVLTLWTGHGPGVDLMLVAVEDPDGVRWLMGRVRFNAGAGLYNPDDRKMPFKMGMGRDAPAGAWELACAGAIRAAETLGVRLIRRRDPGLCAGAFTDYMVNALAEDGFDLNMTRMDKPAPRDPGNRLPT